MAEHIKTGKEIQHRMMDIFRKSNPERVSLNEIEVARVHELEWVLGLRKEELPCDYKLSIGDE